MPRERTRLKTGREYTIAHLDAICADRGVPSDAAIAIKAASCIFPFKANDYILNELIDWHAIPGDPIFRLIFPQLGMLEEDDGKAILDAIRGNRSAIELAETISRIRLKYMPPAAGGNNPGIPIHGGRSLRGMMNLIPGSLLLFPEHASDCFAYCSYCFRWIRTVDTHIEFCYKDPGEPEDYLRANPGISNVVFSGGDPLTMPAREIKRFVEPLLQIDSVRSICFTTRALGWWPYRFTQEPDSAELTDYLKAVSLHNKHVSVIAHITHPRELTTAAVLDAIAVLKESNIVIRCQNPLLRTINDSADLLAELWQREVELGMIPYYLFLESDCASRRYFKIPFDRALAIYRDAQRKVSSLAKTVQGPVILHDAQKIMLTDIVMISGEKRFMFKTVEHPDIAKVGEVFFAPYNPDVMHLSQIPGTAA